MEKSIEEVIKGDVVELVLAGKTVYFDPFYMTQPTAQHRTQWMAIAVSGLAFVASVIIGWYVFRGLFRHH